MDASPGPPIPPSLDRTESKPFDLEKVLAETVFLPPGFEIIPRLLLLLDEPDVNCEALAEVIRVDPALTANVLRICNSAAFGGVRRTDSLVDAITRLGFREIYFAVMKIVSSPVFSLPQLVGGRRFDLWRHSLATAVAAQIIARRTTDEPEELVFTAALLHDVGKVVFAHARGPQYLRVLEKCREGNHDAFTEETLVFQTNHAHVGGRLLELWRFSEKIVAAVAHHHDPTLSAPPHGALSALIYVGNILAYRFGQGNGFPMYAVYPETAVLELIGVAPDDLESYEEEANSVFQREIERFR
jgi:putative nucleotidyltransferase with HDIG domain